jgi:hypothetical protein
MKAKLLVLMAAGLFTAFATKAQYRVAYTNPYGYAQERYEVRRDVRDIHRDDRNLYRDAAWGNVRGFYRDRRDLRHDRVELYYDRHDGRCGRH